MSEGLSEQEVVCSECGNTVDDSSDTCEHCGARFGSSLKNDESGLGVEEYTIIGVVAPFIFPPIGIYSIYKIFRLGKKIRSVMLSVWIMVVFLGTIIYVENSGIV